MDTLKQPLNWYLKVVIVSMQKQWKMTIQLLKQYLELGHLSMYKQWIDTKKSWFFLEETMKAYFL